MELGLKNCVVDFYKILIVGAKIENYKEFFENFEKYLGKKLKFQI